MTPQETVVALAKHIRDTVRPHLGRAQARRITGTAVSGDATFAIDDIAEQAIVEFIDREGLSVAYYSEDKGLIEFGSSPEAVLVIDPIDGTRPAMAGFEQCVVSVAWADYTANPTLGDVHYGCIAELKRNDLFVAERGRGAAWYDDQGERRPVSLLAIDEPSMVPLSFELAGRPMEYVAPVLSGIVDRAGIKGGCFLFNSTAYSLTRLLTGQLAAVLDVGPRILQDQPATRERFVEIGGGKAIGIFTYDIAAAALIAEEAGAAVTDASGRSFKKVPLLDTSEGNLQSLCAASNSRLHAELLNIVQSGMDRLRGRV